mmetsp:Transcript_39959/g.83925  ORF Transcript_39959/g.83925 Transcript_39959/m.83925 type:complete len:218 (-) Transcript_39959:1560-2213(-)
MGKKSKKKGGAASGTAASKASRKEKLQERRQHQLEELDNQQQQLIHQHSSRQRKYFVGDRVWFFKSRSRSFVGNPNTYRGIVKTVYEDGNALDIIPLQSKIDGNENSVRMVMGDVFPDFQNMTLRFKVGDLVMCYIGNLWLPHIITHLWPIEEIPFQGWKQPDDPQDKVPCYKCRSQKDGSQIFVEYDHDNCIRSYPQAFRFNVGDAVVFDAYMAEA